jgi:hypothetical protein
MANSTTRFGSELQGYTPKGERLKELFRPQDVEMLLDQAADLLDRIQRDTTEHFGLEERLAGIEDLAREKMALDTAIELSESIDSDGVELPGAAKVVELEVLALDAERYSNRKQLESLKKSKDSYDTTGRPAESWATQAASDSKSLMADALAVRIAEAKERAKLREEIRKAKLAKSQTAEDAFNFAERRANLRLKLLADGKEAKDRLVQAQEGLKTYYNIDVEKDPQKYAEKDPTTTDALFNISNAMMRPLLTITHFPKTEPVNPQPLMNEYDALHFWTRRAISQVARIVRRDQLFSIPVSVKTLLGGEDKFLAASEKWDLGKIPWPNREAPSLVRLRGLSVSVVMKSGKAPDFDCWQGIITCTSPLIKSPLAVFLGRVYPANALREDDIFGEVMLHNIDPFLKPKEGDGASWVLQLSSNSIRGVKRSNDIIDDVLVTFRVVAQVI